MTSITLTRAKVVFDDITVKTSLNTEKKFNFSDQLYLYEKL